MATVFANKAGQYQLQFRSSTKRCTIYLGKVPKAFADEVCRRVERLIECKEYSQPLDGPTFAWLSTLNPRIKSKIADLGLIESAGIVALGELSRLCRERADVQSSTMQKYCDAEANLNTFFGDDRAIHSITPGDADDFRIWLAKSGRRPVEGRLSLATVLKRC